MTSGSVTVHAQEQATSTAAAATCVVRLDHCRARMGFEKSPKVVVLGTEIPVTTTGKYQRLKLQDLFMAHQATQFKK